MTACVSPHPLRGDRGAPHPDFEVIGAYGDACWARCEKCGLWVWFETDSGKYQVASERVLDRAQAEAALLDRRAPLDVVALLVGHGLPHGPLWELASARVELLHAMTAAATERERIDALEKEPRRDAIWTQALAQMVASANAGERAPTLAELPWAVDMEGDFSGFHGVYEVSGAAFVLGVEPPYRALRISAANVMEFPLAGPAHYENHREDALIARVTSAADEVGIVLFGPSSAIPLRLEDPAVRVLSALDDGHFLFASYAIGTGKRRVEIRDRDLAFVASYHVHLPHHESTPSIPRRVDGGWLASNVVDDGGEPIALVLFDASFEVVARSDDARGPRHELLVLGNGRFAARPEHESFAVEIWSRRGATLIVDERLESRAFLRIGETLVVLDQSNGLRGLTTAGVVRWSARVDVGKVAYGVAVGDRVLVYGGSRATVFRARDGVVMAEIDEPFDLSLAVDARGHGYLRAGPSVLRITADEVARTELDKSYRFATTIGDAIVLADPDDAERYVVLAVDGALRGAFRAPGARFSVIGTRAGPYVLEPNRLRVGAFRV